MRRLGLSLVLILLPLIFVAPCAFSQRNEATLSEGEVEQLRDSAYVANDRVMLFIKFIDARIKSMQDLYARPRRPGREQDTHDLMEQFTSLANELSDNLEDYGPQHRDIRKALPKLVEATERWATAIKTPPDNDAYKISRRIALESIQDLREQSNEMIPEQKAWFVAHPPAKKQSAAEADNAPR
jgi:hypothetical protein